MGVEVKALSMPQISPTAIAYGVKKIETRSWRAPDHAIGTTIAIHVSKGWLKPMNEGDVAKWMLEDQNVSWLTEAGLIECEETVLYARTQDLVRGAIICTATLAGCFPTEDLEPFVGDLEFSHGNFSPGRWGWLLEDVRRLKEPVTYVGALQLWTVDDATAEWLMFPDATVEVPYQDSPATQERRNILTRDFTTTSRSAKIPGEKGKEPEATTTNTAAQPQRGAILMAKTSTEVHPLVKTHSDHILEYEKQSKAAEAAVAAEDKKAAASANAKKSNLSQKIRQVELEIRLHNAEEDDQIEFTKWEQPRSSRKSSGGKPAPSQDQVRTDLDRVGAIFNMPGVDADTVKAANVRIKALLKTAERLNYSVEDPRPEDQR